MTPETPLKTVLGIVIPCYNEEDVLPSTIQQLSDLLGKLSASGLISPDSRMWLVDNGSWDKTWEIITTASASGLPVCGIKLPKNAGHQGGQLAGLFNAEGDAFITVDADLQDDISVIETMVRHFNNGIDIVYGVRSDRSSDSFLKRTSANCFYKLMSLLGTKTIPNHADYRLMSKRVVDSLREFREVNLYLRGIIPMIGFKSERVEYARSKRMAGESKFNFTSLVALSLNGITSFSVQPLRLIAILGFGVCLGSLATIAWALFVVFFTDRAIGGWASTVLPIYFLGGVQLLSLGVIGEYVGKIYLESKGRPRYLVESVVKMNA